jgi:hypothetical protein
VESRDPLEIVRGVLKVKGLKAPTSGRRRDVGRKADSRRVPYFRIDSEPKCIGEVGKDREACVWSVEPGREPRARQACR